MDQDFDWTQALKDLEDLSEETYIRRRTHGEPAAQPGPDAGAPVPAEIPWDAEEFGPEPEEAQWAMEDAAQSPEESRPGSEEPQWEAEEDYPEAEEGPWEAEEDYPETEEGPWEAEEDYPEAEEGPWEPEEDYPEPEEEPKEPYIERKAPVPPPEETARPPVQRRRRAPKARPAPEAVPQTEQPPKPLSPAQRKERKRRRAAAQRQRLHNVILAGAFLLSILVCIIVNAVARDQEFSEAENRSLAGKPAFSWETLFSGDYFAGLEDYVSDQFFLRDKWMSADLKLEALSGKKDAAGVFLGQDDHLLSQPETPDDDAVARSVDAINAFAAENPALNVRMMLIPGAASILTDKLPKNAPVRDQLQDIRDVSARLSGVEFMDVSDTLKEHAEEYIYYKTDHHWTSLGACYAFTAVSGDLGIMGAGNYNVYTVTDSFEGTLASKSGSHKTTDTIEVYEPLDTSVSYYVTYPDSPERVCSLYKRECLENKDKYTVFFGGNYSKVEIDTTAGNDRRLLVFKDSYANCFMQFLTPYYDKIIMIDPRYYYDDLAPILQSEGITDVLLLYSADTFLTDASLADVLETGAPVEDFGQTQAAPTEAETAPAVSPETSAEPSASPEVSPEVSQENSLSPETSPAEGQQRFGTAVNTLQ